MGLDSVELVLEFEKFFRIKIEDREAEKITTLGETVTLVGQKLNINQKSCPIYNEFETFVIEELIQHKVFPSSIQLNDNVLEHINLEDKVVVELISQTLEMEVSTNNEYLSTFWKSIFGTSTPPNIIITLHEFIESIAILNYDKLYSSGTIDNLQQIYLAVAKITYDKMGLNVYELGRDKSYVNDLGID